MKTAMHRLKNHLQGTVDNGDDMDLLCVIGMIDSEYLEVEQQQIIDAYDLGMGHYGDANRRSDAEQYYEQTYNNK